MKLRSFNFKGVKLNDGRLKKQVETVLQEYLSVSNDDLLKGFRLRAGFDAPGSDLGGWYTRDAFHMFGQIISGLARLAAASKHQGCRDKVNNLLAEWARCIAPDGYFFYSNNCNAPHYVYDKMVGGLIDAYLYCDNKESLGYLSRITSWAVQNLCPETRYSLAFDGSREWYTLSENLYRAYLITGERQYKDFARKWEYTEFWDILARNGSIFDRWHEYHAYSHMNSLGGAGAAYCVYGERKYLETLINAYDYFFNMQTYATGGLGPVERFQASRKELTDSLFADDLHFETQCGSWAIFKLVKYLITLTGDSKYGDWAELMIYNGIGASIEMGPPGEVQYWSNYNLFGASKKNVHKWSCCTGTRPMAVADYCDQIWFHDEKNLYVNLYTPSSVSWQVDENQITVSQKGEIGVDENIEFKISPHLATSFKLNFRIPGWMRSQMQVSINGQHAVLESNDQNWAFVDRVWQHGDILTLKLPISLYVKRIDPALESPAALLYGPIVLAGEITGIKEAARINTASICDELVRDSNDELRFTLPSKSSIVLRPYYTFGMDSEYFMYIDPQMARYRQMKFFGWWHNVNNFRYAKDAEATAECVFEGTGIRWNGVKKADAGKAHICIDGNFIDIVDQYHHNDGLPFYWTYKGLKPGKHVLRIKVLGQKHNDSKDYCVNVTSLRAL